MTRRQRYAAGAAGVCFVALVALWLLPVPTIHAPLSTVLLDREGRLLGARIATDEQWRFPALERVPDRYAAAVVQFEDRRFYAHPGVDPIAIVRAVVQNLRAGRVASGASTLTMQVVRLSRENPPRTLPEKVVEAVLALRLELATDKSDILLVYASHAPFGGNTVGLEAAAFRYFGRRPDELSWGEAATLAVLPNSPSLVRPGRNSETLRRKRDRLLDALVEAGVLLADDAALAKAEPLPGEPLPVPTLAPHLLTRAERAGASRVSTTLDASLQARATEVIWRHHETLARNGIYNAAALILDVPTGEARAWVGNVPDLATAPHHNHVDVVTAPRSTGSTLKPFLYLTMLQGGELLPHELVPDLPLRLGGFAPENYDKQYDGAVPAAQALARSRNVPAVWMLKQHGVDRFHGELRRLGLSTLTRPADDYGLALALGGAEATLWDLTSAYRQIAWTLEHARDDTLPWRPTSWRVGDGAIAARPALALDPGAAWQTVEALVEVNRPGSARDWRTFASSRNLAWKTGTSFGFRDGWAIGITPRYAIGVWVGNADGEGRPTLTGYTAAAPVLFDLLDLLEGGRWFERPDDALVEVEVCAHSGQRAGPDCRDTRWQAVVRTSQEAVGCGWCRRITCDEGCRRRVHADCRPIDALHNEPWFVLPASIEQYYLARHPQHRTLPPMADGCEDPGGSAGPLSIITPRDDSEIYVPIELDGARGRVVFQAAHREPGEPIWWHLDDTYVGETKNLHELALAPPPGPHRLTLVDRSGARIERQFTILDKP